MENTNYFSLYTDINSLKNDCDLLSDYVTAIYESLLSQETSSISPKIIFKYCIEYCEKHFASDKTIHLHDFKKKKKTHLFEERISNPQLSALLDLLLNACICDAIITLEQFQNGNKVVKSSSAYKSYYHTSWAISPSSLSELVYSKKKQQYELPNPTAKLYDEFADFDTEPYDNESKERHKEILKYNQWIQKVNKSRQRETKKRAFDKAKEKYTPLLTRKITDDFTLPLANAMSYLVHEFEAADKGLAKINCECIKLRELLKNIYTLQSELEETEAFISSNLTQFHDFVFHKIFDSPELQEAMDEINKLFTTLAAKDSSLTDSDLDKLLSASISLAQFKKAILNTIGETNIDKYAKWRTQIISATQQYRNIIKSLEKPEGKINLFFKKISNDETLIPYLSDTFSKALKKYCDFYEEKQDSTRQLGYVLDKILTEYYLSYKSNHVINSYILENFEENCSISEYLLNQQYLTTIFLPEFFSAMQKCQIIDTCFPTHHTDLSEFLCLLQKICLPYGRSDFFALTKAQYPQDYFSYIIHFFSNYYPLLSRLFFCTSYSYYANTGTPKTYNNELNRFYNANCHKHMKKEADFLFSLQAYLITQRNNIPPLEFAYQAYNDDIFKQNRYTEQSALSFDTWKENVRKHDVHINLEKEEEKFLHLAALFAEFGCHYIPDKHIAELPSDFACKHPL